MSQPAHVERLRKALSADREGLRRLMPVPGCWDGLSALLVMQAGFEAAFLSGGGLSMARLGRPDTGLITAPEVSDAVLAIRDRIDLPLIVDCDTGFGASANVQRTVRYVERAGATAIQIEDQTFPKRCGHISGKLVVPLHEAVDRVRAALDSRHDMLIVARTDAAAVEGIDSAIDRGEAFLEAGADLVFIEGPPTIEDTVRVGSHFGARIPLVHNLVEGGMSATEKGEELEAMGYAVALHPLLLMLGLTKLAPELLAELLSARSTTGLRDRLLDLQQLNQLVDDQQLAVRRSM